MRNPWGKYEWNGDFGDKSKLWTPKLKEQVGFVGGDDGVFCMKLEDFVEYFSFYSVGMFHDGWEYSYRTVELQPNHAEYFRFSIDTPCEAYFRIHQDDLKSGNASEYSCADIFVVKVQENGTYINVVDMTKDRHHMGSFLGTRSTYTNAKYKVSLSEPGEYIVRTKVSWKNKETQKATVSVYSPFKIELEPIERIKNFLPQLLQPIGYNNPQKLILKGYKVAGTGFYSHYFYIYLQNLSNETWNYKANFYTIENVRLAKTGKVNDDTIQIEVPSGETRVYVGKKINKSEPANYNWKIVP